MKTMHGASQAAIVEAVEPGGTLGPYVVHERIGAGGMGEVYRATDPRLAREVAIKLMHSGSERDAQRLKRFENEARAAAQLNHPNILAVLDVGTHEGVPYLVTELLEGQTLRERLEKPFAPGDATDVAKQIAQGLRAAHAHGIVHRDLKPENVFITNEGRAKIIDFGIARFEDEQKGTGTVTATGVSLGTIGYMAPEQVRGLPADARADWFAFGCILYELVGGRRAFHGATSVETGYAILNQAPPPLPEGAPYAALIRACLEKDRERRPQSADEVLAALAGGGVRTPSPAASGTLWKVALGAMITLGVVTVIATRRLDPQLAPAVAVTVDAPDAGPHFGVSMVDLPLPKSSSPEALARYRKGGQELHDGNVAEGRDLLAQALKLDPLMGSVPLRLCLWSLGGAKDCLEARQLRSTLSPREQAMLDALAPPGDSLGVIDVDGGLAREQELLTRYPDDAEIMLVAAIQHPVTQVSQLPEAIALLDRALDLDPKFAGVFWVRTGPMGFGMTAAEIGKQFERCLEVSPGAATCMRNLARLEARKGRCDAYLRYAQRGIAAQPDGTTMQTVLFDASLATGASRDELDALLVRWPEMRSQRSFGVSLEMNAAAQIGELDHAQVDAGTELNTRVFLAHLAEETGDAVGVARQVRSYMRDRVTAFARHDTNGELFDGPMIALALRSGAMSAAETERTLEGWLREYTPRAPRIDSATILRLYTVANAEDARGALEMIERGSPEARGVVFSEVDFYGWITHGLYLGHAALLAGDLDRAIGWLKQAADACFSSETPVLFAQRARLELGDAYERKGDAAAACETYGKILAQWSHPKPRSVTAEKAKARMKALHCAP
jgi:serine/threonine protein kinase/tetratricopeptide (TPR) repeat protein